MATVAGSASTALRGDNVGADEAFLGPGLHHWLSLR